MIAPLKPARTPISRSANRPPSYVRRWAAAVLAGVLTVGMSALAWSAPAAADSRTAPVEGAAASKALEAPDDAGAARMAYRYQRPVLVTGRTSETSVTWAQPDGTFRSSVHAAPERMRDASGRWVAVDLAMEVKADGSVAPKAHPRGLTLSGTRSADSEALVSLGSGVDRVSLGWRGPLPVPAVAGSRATYADVKPGLDLVVEARPVGFEYFLVVKTKAAVSSVAAIAMPYSGPPLSDVPTGTARAQAMSQDPVVSPVVSPARMWDARVSSKSGEPVYQADVAVSTATVAGATDLVLTADPAFFRAPDVVYPVTIDPAIDIAPAFDAFIQNTYSTDQSGSSELKLGYSDDSSEGCGSGCTARSLLNFQRLGGLEGATVASAELFLWNTHSWSCTPTAWEAWSVSFADTSARWSHQPAWESRDGTSTGTKGYGSCSDGWVSVSVRNTFQSVLNNSAASWAKIGLRASSESNHNGWKKFNSSEASSNRPYVELVYNHKPNVPTGLKINSCYKACSSPATVSSGTPTLSATVSDPDGGTMWVEFEVFNSTKQSVVARSGTAVTGVASGKTAPWEVVPVSGTKLANGTYHYRVRACQKFDGAALCSAYTAPAVASTTWFTFTVNTTMPDLPTVVSDVYAEEEGGTWNGGIGQPGSFTFGPNQGTGVTEYIYSLNGGSAVTIPAGITATDKLSTNQQSVTTDLSGFSVLGSTSMARSELGHWAGGSLQLNPKATGTADGAAGDTFASVGGDKGGLQLGMQGGKRYQITGWIYVPPTTGLSPSGTFGTPRGLRITAYAKAAGATTYNEAKSAMASVTGRWQQLSLTLTVPAGATEAFVRVYNGYPSTSANTAKAVYWDDLSVREITGTTSTVTLAPPSDGRNILAVQSRTGSGLTSEIQFYKYLVRSSGESWQWSLDEGAGTVSASTPDNNRPVTASTTGTAWTTPGRAGSAAIAMNGTGKLDTQSPVLNTADAAGFTVAGWARMTDRAAAGYDTVVSQAGANAAMFQLQLREDQIDADGDGTKDLAWCFTMRQTDSPTAGVTAACTPQFVTEDWVHLAGVYDRVNATMTLYVNGGDLNGGVETSVVNNTAPWSATGSFTIGNAVGGADADGWNGDIDEVRAVPGAAPAESVARWSLQ
ncbi:hypothetical protein GCM10020358_59500 [Amorphoplanes nipponensis]|uniref:LamG-like jellyroll fold domain-containing protein n=1 Tax=Actinoplanes nipponensis TaxID=135950 RepID=A0A919JBT4_9ACTN|nr:DNRLRE domain-containing protein [Actinoplanes nipponensis]GIE46928.1 hypothetical protein Ani05nite_04620 [Actinoplanes nipponensis]